MTAEIGTVVGIDREAGIVHAFLASGAAVDAYFMGEPPWPLSTAMFDGAPEYVCLGPLGNRRVAFADDFNFYTAGTPLIGNTGWRAGGTTGSLSTPANPTDGNGVLRLTNNNAGSRYFIRKSLKMVTLSDTRVYWMAARVRQSDASVSMRVGLAESNVMDTGGTGAATDANVGMFVLGAASTSQLQTIAGAGVTTTDTGESAAADTWIWIDVMVAGGQWAAGWVDGSGPWYTTTDVPSASQDSVTPYVNSGSAGTNNVDVDYVMLAQVSPANSPVDLGLGQVPETDL